MSVRLDRHLGAQRGIVSVVIMNVVIMNVVIVSVGTLALRVSTNGRDASVRTYSHLVSSE